MRDIYDTLTREELIAECRYLRARLKKAIRGEGDGIERTDHVARVVDIRSRPSNRSVGG